MKLGSRLLTRLGGLGMASFLHWLSQTLDLQIAHYDASCDPSQPEFAGRGIIVFWHEYIAVPLAYMGKCRISMLNSKHRDADWLALAGHHLGYDVVRGSTGSSAKGGASALRELKQKSRDWTLAITPDGPMGPRRQLELGPLFLSSRLGIPLLPLGVGYDRPWRLNTWDRFAVPRPYSRVRMIWGPRLWIPAGLDRSGLEHYQREVASVITCITTDAESWAASGTRRVGQRPFVKRPPRDVRRFDAVSSIASPHFLGSSAQKRVA
jgi:lysophospholipid acyltransferase (LPLAT)-like uncharacterized protein